MTLQSVLSKIMSESNDENLQVKDAAWSARRRDLHTTF